MRLGPEAIWRREARVMWASLAGGGKRGGVEERRNEKIGIKIDFFGFFFQKKDSEN